MSVLRVSKPKRSYPLSPLSPSSPSSTSEDITGGLLDFNSPTPTKKSKTRTLDLGTMAKLRYSESDDDDGFLNRAKDSDSDDDFIRGVASSDSDDYDETPKKSKPPQKYGKSRYDSELKEEKKDGIEIEDLDLSKYDLSNANARVKSFVALHNYLLDMKRKNLICSDDMQWIAEKVSFGARRDSTAEAFKVYTTNELISGIGTKLMEDTPESRCESLYYKYFSEIVLKNESPHFPLVSVTQECSLCDLCKGTYLELNRCLLVFSELADGSASSYFSGVLNKEKSDDMIYMILQVLMACLTLENHGIVHGDMHLGNILYHSEEEEEQNKGKYIHYIYKGFHIYVKHNGKLWVLWDFGGTTANGKRNPIPHRSEKNRDTFLDDVSRLLNLTGQKLTNMDYYKIIKNLDYVFNAVKSTENNKLLEFIKIISHKENNLLGESFNDIIYIDSKEIKELDVIDPVYIMSDRVDRTPVCPFEKDMQSDWD